MLRPHDLIPEMELKALVHLMRQHFAIYEEHIPGKKGFWVRFIGPPYDSFVPGCKSIQIPTHGRNGEIVSPLCIRQIMAKFEITEARFKEAYNLMQEEIPPEAAAALPN